MIARCIMKCCIQTMLLFGVLIGLLSTLANGEENFYSGKTITLLATTAPGGTGDLRVKAVPPFLKKHIPGNPTVIIEYMDGGGGRKGRITFTTRCAPTV